MKKLIFVDIIHGLCNTYGLKQEHIYENDKECSFMLSKKDKHGYMIKIENTIKKSTYSSEEEFVKEFVETFKTIL